MSSVQSLIVCSDSPESFVSFWSAATASYPTSARSCTAQRIKFSLYCTCVNLFIWTEHRCASTAAPVSRVQVEWRARNRRRDQDKLNHRTASNDYPSHYWSMCRYRKPFKIPHSLSGWFWTAHFQPATTHRDSCCDQKNIWESGSTRPLSINQLLSITAYTTHSAPLSLQAALLCHFMVWNLQ